MTVNVWFQKISIPPPRKTLSLVRKEVSHEPPSPSEFPMIFHGGWGGGVWIFSGTTQLRWMMEVDESELGWIKVNEGE